MHIHIIYMYFIYMYIPSMCKPPGIQSVESVLNLLYCSHPTPPASV